MSSFVFNKIALSNISPQDKVKACADIKMMEYNKDYGQYTFFDYNEQVLWAAFAFNKSFLGFDFWMNISNQIDK